jgi:hypothetical protein
MGGHRLLLFPLVGRIGVINAVNENLGVAVVIVVFFVAFVVVIGLATVATTGTRSSGAVPIPMVDTIGAIGPRHSIAASRDTSSASTMTGRLHRLIEAE